MIFWYLKSYCVVLFQSQYCPKQIYKSLYQIRQMDTSQYSQQSAKHLQKLGQQAPKIDQQFLEIVKKEYEYHRKYFRSIVSLTALYIGQKLFYKSQLWYKLTTPPQLYSRRILVLSLYNFYLFGLLQLKRLTIQLVASGQLKREQHRIINKTHNQSDRVV